MEDLFTYFTLLYRPLKPQVVVVVAVADMVVAIVVLGAASSSSIKYITYYLYTF